MRPSSGAHPRPPLHSPANLFATTERRSRLDHLELLCRAGQHPRLRPSHKLLEMVTDNLVSTGHKGFFDPQLTRILRINLED